MSQSRELREELSIWSKGFRFIRRLISVGLLCGSLYGLYLNSQRMDANVVADTTFAVSPVKQKEVNIVLYSPAKGEDGGERVFTGSRDGLIQKWRVKDGISDKEKVAMWPPIQAGSGGANAIDVSPDGERIMVGCADGSLKKWNTNTGGKPTVEFLKRTTKVEAWKNGRFEKSSVPLPATSVAFSPSGKRILVGYSDGYLNILDVFGKKTIPVFVEAHPKRKITSVEFSPNGDYFLTGSEDSTVKKWKTVTTKKVATAAGSNPEIRANGFLSARFSRDGRWIATANRNGSATVWDSLDKSEKLKPLRTFKGHEKIVYCVDFSPDGKYIVTGSEDATAKVWDVQTGRIRFNLHGHRKGVVAVAFSSDGKHIVTGSKDGTAKIWTLPK